ncbi:MAG TPA: hypothetical protein VGC19_01695 [Rhodanobacter sp.]
MAVFIWVLYCGRNDVKDSPKIPLVFIVIGAVQTLSALVSSMIFSKAMPGNSMQFFDGFTWRTIGIFGIGLGFFFSGIVLFLKYKNQKK